MSGTERGRHGKRNKQSSLAGNHQRCWLWGRNAVLETLRAGRWIPLEILVSEQLAAGVQQEVATLARAATIALQVVAPERLTELCHSREHQGLIAKMPPFPYRSMEELLGGLTATTTAPLVVLLDSLQDPFNFGAVCRAACVFGASAVIVANSAQVEVTSHVARSSAGAINHLAIVQVDDLESAITALQANGLGVWAATISATAAIGDVDLTQPTALVIGNEGQGVQPRLVAACRGAVTIPQATAFNSLNAAVAAGVLLYEVHRQRRSAGR